MTASAPRFSVLLPTHNRSDVVGLAIASVLEQTEPDFELLVACDGCTDNTVDVVRSFTDPRIRLLDLPKAPSFGYANRNVALRQARGRYIAYIAHDDLLFRDHLAVLGECLDRPEVEWAYSRPLWVSTDGVIVPFCTNLEFADEREEFLVHRNTIPMSCVGHPRKALERAGYWPEDVPAAADWILWRRMLGGGQAAGSIRSPTALHFSAAWKQSRHSRSDLVRKLVDIADQAAWWPQALRIPVRSETEQAAAWRHMQDDSPWIDDVRSAVEAVIDRLAWNAIQDRPSAPPEPPKSRRRFTEMVHQLTATFTLRNPKKRQERESREASS
jgi:hypothetical protein